MALRTRPPNLAIDLRIVFFLSLSLSVSFSLFCCRYFRSAGYSGIHRIAAPLSAPYAEPLFGNGPTSREITTGLKVEYELSIGLFVTYKCEFESNGTESFNTSSVNSSGNLNVTLNSSAVKIIMAAHFQLVGSQPRN